MPSGTGTPHVLIVHQSSDAYGSDRACLEVAEALAITGCAVRVVLPAEGWLCGELRSRGIQCDVLPHLPVIRRADVHPVRLPRTFVRWLRGLGEMRSLGRTAEFDLVYANCSVSLGALYLARFRRRCLIWHVHEMVPGGTFGRLLEAMIGRADTVLTCSHTVGQAFRSKRLRARYRVAYTGARLYGHCSPITPLAAKTTRLISVGRLNAWKGQGTLIQAAGILRDAGHAVEVVLVGDEFGGDGLYTERLRQMAADLQLENAVRFLGFRDDAQALVAASDVAVYPAERPEPFGMAVVEAMLLARPVVASDMGGPSEIINDGETGLLVAPGCPGPLADAIASLVRDPAGAREMGHRAQRRAREFRPERMTDVAVEAVYELAGRTGKPRRDRLALDTRKAGGPKGDTLLVLGARQDPPE